VIIATASVLYTQVEAVKKFVNDTFAEAKATKGKGSAAGDAANRKPADKADAAGAPPADGAPAPVDSKKN
jgi:hypothetical protein